MTANWTQPNPSYPVITQPHITYCSQPTLPVTVKLELEHENSHFVILIDDIRKYRSPMEWTDTGR